MSTALPSTTPLPPQALSIVPTIYNEVRPEWFPGVVGDDSVAIQNAINYLQKCISPTGYNRGGTVLLSCKLHTLKSPLVIYLPYSQAVCITLKGPCPANIVGGCATLQFTYSDKPGIIIQTGRTVTLENLNLVGVNNFFATASITENLPFDSSYIVPGISTGRYSPYAAISIDSFENTIAPADQYPGLGQLYANKPGGGSKQIVVKNCAIQKWCVGVMLNSSNANTQGDSVRIHDNIFDCCTYAIACGQSQSRGFDIGYNEYNYGKVCFDWGTFGRQDGTPPSVNGGLASNIKYLCMGISTQNGGFGIRDFYGELICSLGMLSRVSHPNNMPSLFIGGQFNFAKTTQQAEAHLIAGGNVKFLGTILASGGQCLDFNALGQAQFDFDNCDVRTQNLVCDCQIYLNEPARFDFNNSTTWDQAASPTNSSGTRHQLMADQVVWSLGRVLDLEFDGIGGATLTPAIPGRVQVGDIIRATTFYDEHGVANKTFPFTVQGISVLNANLPKVGVVAAVNGTTVVLVEVPPMFDGKWSKVPLDLEVTVTAMQRKSGN